MRVNYKAIADRAVEIIGSVDPLRFEDAFTVMVAELQSPDLVYKILSGTDIRKWVVSHADNTAAAQAIKNAATAGSVSASIAYDLLMGNNSLDLNDPVVYKSVEAMMPTAFASFKAAAAADDVLKYPGLKAGHVQNALEWREEGRV